MLQYVVELCSSAQYVAVCRTRNPVTASHVSYRGGYVGVVQCGAVRCSVVQCGAVCCSVLQCVAVCCTHIPATASHVSYRAVYVSMLQCSAVWCSILQRVALHCTCILVTASHVFYRGVHLSGHATTSGGGRMSQEPQSTQNLSSHTRNMPSLTHTCHTQTPTTSHTHTHTTPISPASVHRAFEQTFSGLSVRESVSFWGLFSHDLRSPLIYAECCNLFTWFNVSVDMYHVF